MVLLLLLTSAWADVYNPRLVPIGERASFLANTGTGESADTGAVYFNPSGLAWMERGKMSVLGSVYMKFTSFSGAITHVDDTNVPYEASGFNTIPSTYVAAQKVANWSFALSVLVPEQVQIENRAPIKTPNITGTILQSYRASELWIGATAATKLSEEWALGWTLFGVQHSESNIAALTLDVPASPNTVATSMSRTEINTYGLLLNLGASYRPASFFSVGLRLQSPLLHLSGTADVLQISRTVIPGQDVARATEDHKSDGKFRLPLDVSLGTVFHIGSYVDVLSDVSLQTGIGYVNVPNSFASTTIDTDATFRANFGLEVKPVPWLPLRLGTFFNPSNLHEFRKDGGVQAKASFWGITGGIGWVTEHVETGIGGFYMRASGESTPDGGTNLAEARSKSSGGLITTSYVF